jgi:LmbE family N-acetylglucosaminyl deacetylase
MERRVWWGALVGILFLVSVPLQGADISVDGGPTETGSNSGTFAYIHATVRGITGEPKRYVVSAEIQYFGTTANASVEMDPLPETKSGVEEFQGGWPIPFQAPTGFYTVTLHVDDRIEHLPGLTKKARGFVVYKKSIRISRVTLDKSLYNVGDPIRCGVAIENLSDTEVKGLHVEFSNAIYPWIQLTSQGGRENPDLEVSKLRDDVNISPGTAVGVPMMTARTAAFLSNKDDDEGGIDGGADQRSRASEVEKFAVTVWNEEHTVLYDMQFTPQVIVRTLMSDGPKAYNGNYAHPFVEFAKYREFYAAGQVSDAIRIDPAHTLYRPGDTVNLAVTLKNPSQEGWNGASLRAQITDSAGREAYSGTIRSGIDLAPAAKLNVSADAWKIPGTQAPGTYPVELKLVASDGKVLAQIASEIAINPLPASLLIVCPHEGDEHAYAGLIRAAIESQVPVQVLILTAGDVTQCARYFSKPCGPNEAQEYGSVRMEESAQALGHLGLPRDKLNILGLPENGLGAIWFEHKDSTHPYLSISLGCDHAPYGDIYRPNLAYSRDAVVAAIRQVLTDTHPSTIVVTNPDEGHLDHRVTNWLTIEACRELLKTKQMDPQTVILTNPPYGVGSSKSAPYKYENFTVHLSGEAAALKQEMSWAYQTQSGNRAEVERKDLAELPRAEQYLRITDWQEHDGWNEEPGN